MTELSGRDIGQRLRIARLALGITEQEAADAAKITLRTWGKWEDGSYSGRRNIVDFAHKFDVSLDWLIVGEGAGVSSHLTGHAKGKIAILPVDGPRRRRARQPAA